MPATEAIEPVGINLSDTGVKLMMWRRRRRRRRRRKRRRRMMMVILCLSMDRQVNGKINEGNNKDKKKETQCLDLTCPYRSSSCE